MKSILKDYRDKYENCLLTGEEFDFDGLETELQAWADGVAEEKKEAEDEFEEFKRDRDKLIEALGELRDDKRVAQSRYVKEPFSGEIAESLLELVDADSIKEAFKQANSEAFILEIKGLDARTKFEDFLSTELYPLYNDIREIL